MAAAIAASVKNRGGAELLRPIIKRTTTTKATPAVPIVIEDRKAARRCFCARSSYRFIPLSAYINCERKEGCQSKVIQTEFTAL